MGARSPDAVSFGARWLGLLFALAIGAALRLDALASPSLWLDEILGYDLTTRAMARPWWAWLTGLEAEHGPLYYATQLAGRAFAGIELEARVVAAFFGVCGIVLIWLAANEIAGPTAAFAAATLLATSPLHVYYSREARPYALSMLLAAALLLAIARAPRAVPWLVLAAVYTSATALPLALSAVVAFAFTRRDGQLRPILLSALPIAAALYLYRGDGPANADVSFPALDVRFFDSLMRSFSVTAIGSERGGNAAIVFAMLAATGAFVVWRRRDVDRRGLAVVALFVLPVVIALAALATTQHWFAVRYVSPALPAFIVLIAIAIDSSVRFATRRLPERAERWLSPALVVLATGALMSQTLSPARMESHRKLNWRLVASAIWSHAAVGDVVAAAEPWSAVSLEFYLRRLPPRVRFRALSNRITVDGLLDEYERGWFVTASHSPDAPTAQALCRFPILLSSELENFRLHYAPSLQDFVATRSTPAESNALLAARGGAVLEMGREDDLFMRGGWSDAEGSARWAVGRRAEVLILSRDDGPRTLEIDVGPLWHAGLPAQEMRVIFNDVLIATTTLREGQNALRFPVAARAGMNRITFEFSRANAPRDLDSSFTDGRPLTAMFDRIALDATRQPASPASVRLHEGGEFLDERSAWRDHESRLDPMQWNRSRVSRLLGRLGLDSSVALAKLARREVAIEDLLASSSLLRACDDDETFVRTFWRVVFDKSPNAIEEKVLRGVLAKSRTRAEFARRIARMSEFRDSLQR